MAPFRSSRSTRHSRPGGAPTTDHDVFDGLPVRQWRQQETTVQPPDLSHSHPHSQFGAHPHAQEPAAPGQGRLFDKWAVERPMPRGSELYVPWCQQILRAARAGKIAKARDPSEIARERQEKEEAGGEEGAAKDGPKTFLARRWQQVARAAEEPETEYLAKRRKGLTSAYALTAEGAVVNIAPVEAAPVVEERRRNIPPRRKPKKGFQKKKKMSDGAGLGVSASAEALQAKKEAAARAAEGEGGADGDVVMGEGGDEDDDGEDGEEDDDGEEGEGEGEEGEGDEDDEGQAGAPSVAEEADAKTAEDSNDAKATETVEEDVKTAPTADEDHPMETAADTEGKPAEDDIGDAPVAKAEPVESTNALPEEPASEAHEILEIPSATKSTEDATKADAPLSTADIETETKPQVEETKVEVPASAPAADAEVPPEAPKDEDTKADE